MSDTKNILDQISDILIHYQENSVNESIDSLLHTRDQLAVLSYRMAEICGDSKGDYNKLYFLRKIAVAKSTHQIQQKGLAFNKAEGESLLKHEQEYRKELTKEAEAYKNDILLKQCNKVLEAMMQRISYLKTEQQQSKYENQT